MNKRMNESSESIQMETNPLYLKGTIVTAAVNAAVLLEYSFCFYLIIFAFVLFSQLIESNRTCFSLFFLFYFHSPISSVITYLVDPFIRFIPNK